jgi:sterol 24-C-methyltransferase
LIDNLILDDLVTDFYEYGWGHSFHFAPRFKGESFDSSIARHEHWLGLKLALQPGMKVADLGCGIGGPMRAIARFTGANIIGVNNNDYQISRCNRINVQSNLSELCKAEKGNFLHLEYPENSFDAAYAIEATCHAPERVKVFQQIFKILKKGGLFASYEWALTDKYDPRNPEHVRIKKDIEEGDSLPDLIHYNQVIQALKDAGFEVIQAVDLAVDQKLNNSSWYASLQGGWSLQNLPHTQFGTRVTHFALQVMEFIGIAPKGSVGTHEFLLKARDSLQLGGETGIFTPMYFVLARKP